MRKHTRLTGIVSSLQLVAFSFGGERGLGQEITTELVGEAHAKGVVALRASFGSRVRIADVSLEMSVNGEDYVTVSTDLRGALPRFVSNGAQRTDVDLLIDQDLKSPCPGPAFHSPGRYYLRWHIRFDEQPTAIEVDQIVDVGSVTDADACFLERAGDQEMLISLLGRDPFAAFGPEVREAVRRPENADCRAFPLIAMLKESMGDDPRTLAKTFPRELERRLWADTIYELLEACPQSSYAPYAACFAGTFYVAEVEEANRREHQSRVAPQAKDTADYRRARRALTIATANPYLAGNAYYKLALLSCFAADWSEMDAALASAETRALNDEDRRDFDELRQSLRTVRETYERENK